MASLLMTVKASVLLSMPEAKLFMLKLEIFMPQVRATKPMNNMFSTLLSPCHQ